MTGFLQIQPQVCCSRLFQILLSLEQSDLWPKQFLIHLENQPGWAKEEVRPKRKWKDMWGHIKTSSLIFQNQKLSLKNPTKSLMPPLEQLLFCTLSFPEELWKIQEREREQETWVQVKKKKIKLHTLNCIKVLKCFHRFLLCCFYFGWRIESSINSCVVRKEIRLEKWVDV